MSILTNTEDLRTILSKVNALPEVSSEGIVPTGTLEITENGEYDVTEYAKALVEVMTNASADNAVIGSFTLASNLTDSTQVYSVELGAMPDAVIIYRKTWKSGVQSINTAFNGDFSFSVCNTASSGKAVEKLVGGSYITKTEDGFTITGNSTYYWVGGEEYVYVAVSDEDIGHGGATTTEAWTFTMEDGSTVTKEVVTA